MVMSFLGHDSGPEMNVYDKLLNQGARKHDRQFVKRSTGHCSILLSILKVKKKSIMICKRGSKKKTDWFSMLSLLLTSMLFNLISLINASKIQVFFQEFYCKVLALKNRKTSLFQ